MGTVINATAHGFSDGDPIFFANLEGGEGITEGIVYYVLAGSLTADTFTFAASDGGAPVAFTTDITAGDVTAWPTYAVDSDGPHSPPDAPTAPDAPTLDSDVHDLVIRLKIALPA